jgi:hypothetical protein
MISDLNDPIFVDLRTRAEERRDPNFIGVTITKDLACVAVVGVRVSDLDYSVSIEQRETIMFTFTDGRAFRSVPYFNSWRAEFTLHDNNIEDVEFGRSLADICDKWSAIAVGYDPDQTKLMSRSAVAIDKTSAHAEDALLKLNARAQEFGGILFPKDSAKEYMWQSLPTLNGLRVFPTGDLLARGRYDSTHAVVNALAAALSVYKIPSPAEIADAVAQRKAYQQRKLCDQRRQVEEYWESLPSQAVVLVENSIVHDGGFSRFDAQRRMTMAEALPLLKAEKVRFVRLECGWTQYAWRGFKPVAISDDND